MIRADASSRTNLHYDDVLTVIDRLYNEQPMAMTAFLAWVREPGHTSTVTLIFRDGVLQRCERAQTAK